MCGISALYRYTKVSKSDLGHLQAMNREMHYRGPDGEGYWHDDTCAMAHTRLSIIGLDNGAQPLYNADQSLVLVCNGEIYNYKELRAHVVSKGYTCRTDSDCEPILYLYEIYGADCVQYLRGMFAFCLYDTRKKQLFAARDRAGEKTLYYAQLPTGIVFSSELKAILKNYIPHPQINGQVLAESIRYNYPIELKNTYIEQIKRLQPGQYALVDADGLTLHRYWKRDFTPRFEGTRQEAQAEVLRLMRESVANCLQSDVPVAVLLSGGIDSSAIAAFAKETGKEIHVISAGYKGSYAVDERNVAKRFAAQKGLIYHEIELDANDFAMLFDEYMPRLDEPVCDVSSMSQYALYKKARELGFKVLLSGVGGDELFFGYPSHNKQAETLMLRKQFYDVLPANKHKAEYLRFVFKHLRHVLFAGQPYKLDDQLPVEWTYKDYLQFIKNGSLDIYGQHIDFKDYDVHVADAVNSTPDEFYNHIFERFMTGLCLYLADRLGMANSVELRAPMLDYKLIEFVSSLPLEMRFDVNNAKSLLKDSLQGIVPDYILYARKRGFEPPFDYIREMNRHYQYRHIESDHVFFNSMLADRLIDQQKMEEK